jgi:hypothetical protein
LGRISILVEIFTKMVFYFSLQDLVALVALVDQEDMMEAGDRVDLRDQVDLVAQVDLEDTPEV